MKKSLFALTLLLWVSACFATEIIYVSIQASSGGSGINWEDAYALSEFNIALEKAQTLNSEKVEIWITGGDIILSSPEGISIPENISIIGGFSTDQTEYEQTSIDDREKTDLNSDGIIQPWEYQSKTAFSYSGSESKLTLLTLAGDNITLDGLAFQNHSCSDGSLIHSDGNNNIQIKNCLFANNLYMNWGQDTSPMLGTAISAIGGSINIPVLALATTSRT